MVGGKFCHIVLLILVSAIAPLAGQNISPFVISSTGAYGTTGSTCLSWTVGETAILTVSNGNSIITQGFHQPVNDSIPFPPVGGDSGLVIYSGITPNGDNFNDAWIIGGIDTLTNSVSVFNRWGDLVWKAENYDNTSIVWKGDNQAGQPLPAGTYFYVIIVEGSDPYKGWVEVSQ